MNIKRFCSVLLMFFFFLMAYSSLAYAEPNTENLSISNEPIFSLDEPWTLAQFGQKFVEKKYAPSEKDVTLEQGKTVKNKSGKAYFLTAATGYQDDGYAILGLRDLKGCEGECVDSYEVQFYLLYSKDDHRTMLKQWGSVYRTYAHHEIVDIYKGSVHGLVGLVTFVEFDEIFV